MAFVPEDGTGLADANSYVTLAEFQAYWIERGIDMSQYSDTDKQVSLVLATEHVDLFWGPKFFGYKMTKEQALEFPRHCIYDSDGYLVEGVPKKLKAAVCEYAKRNLVDNVVLAPDPTTDPSGLQVNVVYKKVGPIEKRTTFTGSVPKTLPSYPKADAYLKEFVWGTGGGSYRA